MIEDFAQYLMSKWLVTIRLNRIKNQSNNVWGFYPR
jgi:hypothetical protein